MERTDEIMSEDEKTISDRIYSAIHKHALEQARFGANYDPERALIYAIACELDRMERFLC
jgi:hypothetical protein